jgi:hypothetical protein
MDHARPPISTKLGKLLDQVNNLCGFLYSNVLSFPDALPYRF